MMQGAMGEGCSQELMVATRSLWWARGGNHELSAEQEMGPQPKSTSSIRRLRGACLKMQKYSYLNTLSREV